jgi:phosphoribosylamine--glycine ligase
MNFLFVSKWGETLDLAYTIQNEGHKVKMYIEDAPSREIGYGFIPKIRLWQSYISWAHVIVFDYVGYGKQATELRQQGKLVIGGTEYTDKLEMDRNFGQEEMKRLKIKILNYSEFSTTEAAIEYVKKHPAKYVIKPSQEMQEFKQLLYVGQEETGEDIIRMLKAYQKTWGDSLGHFLLQKKVSGVEVSVAAYFNGKEFLKPINITFEHKKLFPKELGVSTGEMGTSMFWTDNNPIFEATLQKFEKKLAKEKFTGHIDINCIVNGKGIYPLEFTSRFGYPQIQIQRSGIVQPMGELLYKTASGEHFKIETKKGFQIGVYIVVPPFPYEDKKTFNMFSKDAVVVLKKKNFTGLHPMHLKLINDEWLITGNSGVVMVVTGTGITMKEAQKNMYSRVNNVLVNNSYYRTDIGDRWATDFDRLWAWNLL